MTNNYNFFVVGMGASTSELKILAAFRASLPHNTEADFWGLQQLPPNFKSIMAELLQKHTKMPLLEIIDNVEYQDKVQELTELSNDLDNLLRSTNIGVIFLDQNLNIRKFTPAATKIINICATDINRPLRHFTYNIDFPQLVETLQEVIQTGEVREYEVKSLDTGENFLMRINHYYKENNNIRDGIVLTFVNIDKLKKTQAELEKKNLDLEIINNQLEQERKRLKQIIDNAPVAIAIFDQKMNYLAYSQQWLKDYNLSSYDLMGKNHYEIFPEIPDHWKEIHQKALQGEAQSCEDDIFERENGEIVALNWGIQPWYTSDRQVGGIILVSQMIERLIQTREAALESSRLKTEFLANMSHEIRTPMNAIIGFSDLLKYKITDPKQVKYLDNIINSSKNLLQLINDILDISKIEAGKLEIRYEPIYLKAYFAEIKQIFSHKIEDKNLNLSLEIADNCPEIIEFDSVRLRQILFNLIGNAIKFTEEGFVKIQVTIMEEQNQERETSSITLKISVNDTGIGIAPTQQALIFEPFVQGDGSSTRQYSGTGLGLSITKRLTQILGGQITIESTVNQGSNFTVIFPHLKVIKSIKSINSEFKKSNLGIDQLKFHKVLIVDDVESNREIIAGCLMDSNCEILMAENGIEALEISRKQMPNLIFLDLRMPKMNGEEFIKIMKAQEETKHIPIIVITASIKPESEQLKHSVQGFLRKPIKCSDVISQIKHLS